MYEGWSFSCFCKCRLGFSSFDVFVDSEHMVMFSDCDGSGRLGAFVRVGGGSETLTYL